MCLRSDLVQFGSLDASKKSKVPNRKGRRGRCIKIRMVKGKINFILSWMSKYGKSFGKYAIVSFLPTKMASDFILSSPSIPLKLMILVCIIVINVVLMSPVQPSSNMQIFVKRWSGKSVAVNNLSPCSSVSSLILCLDKILGPDSYLLYNGKCLQHDKILNYYGISQGSTLHEIRRLRGGTKLAPTELQQLLNDVYEHERNETEANHPPSPPLPTTRKVPPSYSAEAQRLRRAKRKEAKNEMAVVPKIVGAKEQLAKERKNRILQRLWRRSQKGT